VGTIKDERHDEEKDDDDEEDDDDNDDDDATDEEGAILVKECVGNVRRQFFQNLDTNSETV
jgi:hypothetical protein